MNIDPRLFLSSQPATLPPIAAQWYRDMSPSDIANAEKSAAKFIQENVAFTLGSTSIEVAGWKFLPMDGATNEPLKPDSTEVHLLADVTLKLPQQATSLGLALNNKCAAALTMLTAINGKAERRPQVIFPGENSRPIKWEAAPTAAVITQPAPSSLPPPAPAFVWYEAPLSHGFTHIFRVSSWAHFLFLIALVVTASTKRLALLGLAAFHFLHTVTTYGCALQNTVWQQPAWLWPLAICALLLCKGKPTWLFVGGIAVLAALHSLNEWPHAATPAVIAMLEIGFAAAQFVVLIPLLLILPRPGTKKDGP